MKKSKTYKFKCRPGFSDKKLLIEITSGVEQDSFSKDFLEAIRELKPIITERQDLWVNDEVLHVFDSNCGTFTLSADIWGLGFIMSENDDSCILKINKLLNKSDKFVQTETENTDYKPKSNDGKA